MKKIYLLIFVLSLFLVGCAQESAEQIKDDSEEMESFTTGLSMESYECPFDIKTDMYIDSVCLVDKFQILLLSKENGDFVLKREIMEKDGEWKEETQKIDKSIADHIGNKGGKSSCFTKICKESEDTLYALWQEYSLIEQKDNSFIRKFIKFGIVEIDTNSWNMKMLWTNSFDEENADSGVTDFGITDVGDFALYFGQSQKIINYEVSGDIRNEFDMKNTFSGVAQFDEGDIWVLSQERNELLRYGYSDGKVKKESSTPCEADENAQIWKVFGKLDETLYLCKNSQLYIVEESKGLKEITVNKKIPVTFSDYANSETGHVCYLLGKKMSGEEESETSGNCLQVYVIDESK